MNNDTAILCNRITSPSARALGNLLNIPVFNNPTRIQQKTWKKIIRWGSSSPINTPSTTKIINTSNAIQQAADKSKAFTIWKTHTDKIKIPKIYGIDEINSIENWPVLLRKPISFGARDIIIANDKDTIHHNLITHPLIIQFIPLVSEYRLHIFNQKCYKISKKVLTNATKWSKHHMKNYVKNFSTGYTFRHPYQLNNDIKKLLKNTAKLAVSTLELDFGAVDLLLNYAEKEVTLLEVNTGPGLSPNSLALYSTAIEKEFLQ